MILLKVKRDLDDVKLYQNQYYNKINKKILVKSQNKLIYLIHKNVNKKNGNKL